MLVLNQLVPLSTGINQRNKGNIFLYSPRLQQEYGWCGLGGYVDWTILNWSKNYQVVHQSIFAYDWYSQSKFLVAVSSSLQFAKRQKKKSLLVFSREIAEGLTYANKPSYQAAEPRGRPKCSSRHKWWKTQMMEWEGQ